MRWEFSCVLAILVRLLPGHAYNSWHLIDAAQVVCNADGHSMSIDFRTADGTAMNGIDLDATYIFSFIRADRIGAYPLDLTFKVQDAAGTEVVPNTSVILQAFTDPPLNPLCTCTGEGPSEQLEATVGANYGSSCGAWDNSDCSGLWPDITPGAWCCRPWCYASPECYDAYSSALNPGKSFSYLACEQSALANPCTWTSVVEDACACRDVSSLFNEWMNSRFASDYGATCSAWDNLDCHTNYPDSMDTWCCESWCYVDRSCPTAKASFNPGMEDTLFWTETTCDQDPAFIAQCAYANGAYANQDHAACACTGEMMPESLVPTGADRTTYGVACSTHDKDMCEEFNPGVDVGMWCCYSWCWVESTCSSARASAQWPGHYYSVDVNTCPYDEEVISSCKYSNDCDCLSDNTGIDTNTFPANYGLSCNNWDANSCSAWWSSTALWDSSGTNDWCCDSWCYVSAACPIAVTSSVGVLFPYSYTTCDDTGPQTYSAGTDTCVSSVTRRLEEETKRVEVNRKALALQKLNKPVATSQPQVQNAAFHVDGDEDDDEDDDYNIGYRTRAAPWEPVGAIARRLSSRRRAGGSSSSSARRRDPRRRGPAPPPPSRPATPDLRRRAPVRRRRAPPPRPAAAFANVRRRGADVSGNSYSSPATGGVPYGYSSPQQLNSNFGGTPPQQTSYGYSGGSAFGSGSSTNMVMAGGAGFAAGALTTSYFDGRRRWGSNCAFENQASVGCTHRRRRQCWDDTSCNRAQSAGTAPTQWCTVAEDVPGVGGSFMECLDCINTYGISKCMDATGCVNNGGCPWTLPEGFGRDDLSQTGFEPALFTSPLVITFSKISGAGFSPLEICPPTTESEIQLAQQFNRTMLFRADFFLTFAAQTSLSLSTCESDTGYFCKAGSNSGDVGLVGCYGENEVCENGLCACQAGFCAIEGGLGALECVAESELQCPSGCSCDTGATCADGSCGTAENTQCIAGRCFCTPSACFETMANGRMGCQLVSVGKAASFRLQPILAILALIAAFMLS